MSTNETIYQKYWNALVDVDAVMAPADTAIALALRLAIDEAIATHPVALKQPSTADRAVEWQQAQIGRLNDWLQVHEPGLYISPGDTADAVLAALGYRDKRIAELLADIEQLQTDANAEFAELQEDLTSARNELALLIANRDALVTALQTDYSQAGHVNGAKPPTNPTATPEWNRNHPAWNGMADEEREALYQLMNGGLSFRQISREDRIDLVGRVLRHLAEAGETVTGPQFDRLKPAWMPTAGAVVLLAESRKWQGLVDLVKAHA